MVPCWSAEGKAHFRKKKFIICNICRAAARGVTWSSVGKKSKSRERTTSTAGAPCLAGLGWGLQLCHCNLLQRRGSNLVTIALQGASSCPAESVQVHMDQETAVHRQCFWWVAGVACWPHGRVGEAVRDAVKILKDFSLFPKWSRADDKRTARLWLRTSPSPTVCFLPSVRSRSLTATEHRSDTNSYARLMKPLLCCFKQ